MVESERERDWESKRARESIGGFTSWKHCQATRFTNGGSSLILLLQNCPTTTILRHPNKFYLHTTTGPRQKLRTPAHELQQCFWLRYSSMRECDWVLALGLRPIFHWIQPLFFNHILLLFGSERFTLRSFIKEVVSCGVECGPILNECWDEYERRDRGAFAPRSLLEAAVITLLHSSVLKLGVLTGEGGWGMAGIYDWFVLPLDLKFWNVTQFEETTKIALLYRCCYH